MSKTFLKPAVYKMDVERSQFIALLFPLKTEPEFKEIHKSICKLHPKATHVCYAYKVNEYQKFSDDGEPSKTAGFPIMETILQQDLDEVAVFVVRYFGGIKLGTGGLARAYRDCAHQVILVNQPADIINLNEYELRFHYSLVNLIDRFLTTNHILINNKKYEMDVVYVIATQMDFKNDLIELVHNQINIQFIQQKKYYIE